MYTYKSSNIASSALREILSTGREPSLCGQFPVSNHVELDSKFEKCLCLLHFVIHV